MTIEEIAVIVLCLFGGYWIVSLFIAKGNAGAAHATNARQSQETPWPIVLGVEPHATIDEIKQAYRQRMSEYHPDKVAGMGMELRELAERKAKEINRAYAQACRMRGEAA